MNHRRCVTASARYALVASLAVLLAGASFAADIPDSSTWDKGPGFKAETVWDLEDAEWNAQSNAIRSGITAEVGRGSASFTILSANPNLPEAGQAFGARPETWYVETYDYARELGLGHEVGLDGKILSTKTLDQQPFSSPDEFKAASDYVHADPVLGTLLRNGEVSFYEPMPPVDFTPGAPRTVHVGLMPANDPTLHEIVGVVMATGEVVRYASKAPAQAMTQRGSCGPPSGGCQSPCIDSNTGSGVLNVSWPAANPVWTFDVVRPGRTGVAATPAGTGIEIRNARFNGEMVLLQGGVPHLNVKYDGDACGPFRDWMDSEDWFNVTGGESPQSGFYRGGEVPATICVDNTDAGNFRGVGIQDSSRFIYLTSELSAGWYRYLMGWYFYENGDIKAEFYYNGTFNGCTCQDRTHHAYWRLDFAVDGVANAGTNGGWDAAQLFQRRATNAPDGVWNTESLETTMLRTFGQSLNSEFRVFNTTTSNGYEFFPSKDDNSAPDAEDGNFGVTDLMVVAYNNNQLTDSTGGLPFRTTFDNDENIEQKRIVVWYGVHMRLEDVPGEGIVGCKTLGPLMRRVSAPLAPELDVDIDSLNLEVASGSNLEPSEVVVSRVAGNSEATFTVTDDLDWLTVRPASGTIDADPATLTLEYDTAALGDGTYTGTITIDSPEATNGPFEIPVELIVFVPAVLDTDIDLLEPIVQSGSTLKSQVVRLSNTGGSEVNFTVSSDANWLLVDPAKGNIRPAGEAEITVSFDVAALAVGTYTATITIDAPGAANSPFTIPVTLTVEAAPVSSGMAVKY